MFDILFAYIFSIYGNEYGCKMIKKIDILGIQLDNYTVREAIMRVEAWYDNNMLNVIEMVSMQMLTESESDPVLKEVISSLDLAVIGEKGLKKYLCRLKKTPSAGKAGGWSRYDAADPRDRRK